MDEKKPSTNVLVEIIVAVLIVFIILGIFGVYLGIAFEWYSLVIQWFYTGWVNVERVFAIIFIVLSMGAIGFIGTILGRFFSLRDRIRKSFLPPVVSAGASASTPVLESEAAAGWREIRALANSGNPSDWNMAVLRADALLDEILAREGYEGETIAERLKVADPTRIPSLDRLWSAHRVRNMIAHDPLEQHTKETVIAALRSYETALKELGVIREEPLP